MKILKFGGTSVSTPDRIKTVIDIVAEAQKSERVGVVFSAFGGATDQLIQISQIAATGDDAYLQDVERLENKLIEFTKALISAKRQSKVFASVKSTFNELEDTLNGVYLVKELTARTLDFIMSFGERLSAYIISEAMKEVGLDTKYVDSREFIKTDETFGAARVNIEQTYRKTADFFRDRTAIPVITGFIGSTIKNETTTLGRSGSDYTASVIGAAVMADSIDIWTDVDGIMTADPRVVPSAFSLNHVTYEEAMEMSHFGTKVIHPSAMQPAFERNIPIRIRNTFNQAFGGTVISRNRANLEYLISGISSVEQIALLRVQGSGMIGVTGISSRLFTSLARVNINIILITQASSEHTICFAVAPEDALRAKEAIEKEFALEIQAHQIDRVIVEKDLSIVAAVGENMRHTPGIAGRLFQILGKNDINVVAIAQGSSELNISAVIDRTDEARALNAIHSAFFKKESHAVNLFLVGTGRVGGALLKQMHEYIARPYERKKHDLHILGIANSRKMLFDQAGIHQDNWRERMDREGEAMTMEKYVNTMRKLNLSNCVLVDCTASDEVADWYKAILESGISVVAANKKANSGAYHDYLELKDLASSNEVLYLYETNVCAGLPVIQTIQDLVHVGDHVQKIEAVVSGTLSYIFNTFSGERPFSDIVLEAQEKGYTEPDPRNDLDGMDMVRKLLILARESGLPLEMDQVANNNFLPPECLEVETVDEFFEQLKNLDPDMEEKREAAIREGKRLMYIASLENNHAEISMKAIDETHPFYLLTGNDNIIALTTRFYNETPMVIQGPGAGPEVTAAGVFTDLLQVATHIKTIKEGES